MLKNQIQTEILSHLDFAPTPGQTIAIGALANFVVTPTPDTCVLLKGYAGTGKTSIIAAYVKTLDKLKVKYELLAPTGRAAKVLTEYSGAKAHTIHKCIYRQKNMHEGVGSFVLNYNKLSNAIFIVDEASMLSNSSFENSAFGSGKLLADLTEFVKQGKNCRLILVGDTAQLPPVGLDLSPALNSNELTDLNLEVTEILLTEVVRQQHNSGILHNATLIRDLLDTGRIASPKFITSSFTDFENINGGELLEHLANEYNKNGKQGNVVICYSNKQANRYNNGIRSRVLYSEEELSVGDYLMVTRNSYFWVADMPEIGFIANGDVVEVTRIGKRYDMYGFRFADVTIRLLDDKQQLVDVRIILDSLMMDGPSLGGEQMKELYQQVALDYAHVKTQKARLTKIKEDPFFNAIQVKFAYAVTCHKAQGGQWPKVFIDQGFFRPEMLTREYLRWLYTAITRATEKVYLVNFDKSFFE
ncbi:MAG: AAA family ATPase [Bacteroidales bacterium]|nr:AAA family ATPase [Bacteroidales bacterium]